MMYNVIMKVSERGRITLKKIGIICASPDELKPFFSYIEEPKIRDKAMLKFYEGKIHCFEIVLVFSGVCKVNAAIAAQVLIDSFSADAIINAGTAGGMRGGVSLLDTVVSEETAYHDVGSDILTELHPWMDSVYFQSDDTLLAAAREYSGVSPYPLLFGRTVTGEQFIEDKNREEINRAFSPLAVDMETAGIAHVCYVNKIPFIAIRSITDTATHQGLEHFEKNCRAASERSAEVVIGVLDKLAIKCRL